MSDELRDAVQRKGSFLGTIKAVAWSFFGVRGGRAHQRDVSKLNPVHVIIAGLVLALLFILLLVTVVRLVTA